jgi:hypothetical protein
MTRYLTLSNPPGATALGAGLYSGGAALRSRVRRRGNRATTYARGRNELMRSSTAPRPR